jgi:hypothetical protein
LAACGHQPDLRSDWEREQEAKLAPAEQAVSLPPYPPQGERLEFSLGPASEFRFFIDASSLSVADGLVRYVLIARSPAGVENVTYEGMRCSSGEVRLYALGRDGGWRGAPGAWRSPLAWHRELHREYFCSVKYPVRNRADALAALRR